MPGSNGLKWVALSGLGWILFVGCSGCSGHHSLATGRITGTAKFEGETNHAGIRVTAQRVVDGRTEQVQALIAGRPLSRGKIPTAVTDAQGAFTLENLPVGVYVVRGDHDSARAAEEKNVPVEKDQTTTVQLILQPTGIIRGQVTLEGAEDHSGTVVYLVGHHEAAYTDAAGDFEIRSVPVGSYSLAAARSDYQTRTVGPIQVKMAEATVVPAFQLWKAINHDPVIDRVTAVPVSVRPGGTATLTAQAHDPDGHPLVYGWSVEEGGGSLSAADGPSVTYTAPAEPGVYTVHVSVSDGRGGVDTEDVDIRVSDRDRAWTILVFMNADNDLERYGVDDLNEMEQIGSTDEVAIVVQMDRTPGFSSSNGDWTDTRRYLVVKDEEIETITSPVLESMGEIDMGDPQTVREFIAWGQANYPAQHYLVDLWDHGSGWRSRQRRPEVTRGVSFDDTSNTYLDTTDLPAALQAAEKPDLVVFDSSLMQMLEVAYEIRTMVDIIVGSEESPPGEGYPYHEWLGPLVENPALTPTELAQLIVNRTVEVVGQRYDVTQSALAASKLDDLAAALDEYAATLLAFEPTDPQAFARARNAAQSYGGLSYQTYKDLLSYADEVARETGSAALAAAARTLKAALNRALLAEAHQGSSVNRSHGLSIYVPPPEDYSPRYDDLALAQATRWDEWLKAQPD